MAIDDAAVVTGLRAVQVVRAEDAARSAASLKSMT